VSELAAEEIKTSPYVKSVCSLSTDRSLGGNYTANLKVKCIRSPKLASRSFYRRNKKWQIRHLLPVTPH